MKNLLILGLSLLMTGCATKEYLNAQNECSPAAFRQYPVNSVQTYVQRTRSVQVPTGAEDCETRTEGNRTYTRCKPEMKTRSVPYQSLEWVDTNLQARNAYLKSCTAQVCLKRFGNQECEPVSKSSEGSGGTPPATSAVVAPPTTSAVAKKPQTSTANPPVTKAGPKSGTTSSDDDDDDD